MRLSTKTVDAVGGGQWAVGLPSGQAGREVEVRESGRLNDSYERLPERLLLLFSTPAVGYDSFLLKWRVSLCSHVGKFKVIDWAGELAQSGCCRYLAHQLVVFICFSLWESTKENSSPLGSPSSFRLICIVSPPPPHLCWAFSLLFSRHLISRPCSERDKERPSQVQRVGWQDHCLWTFEPSLWER